MCKLDMKDAYFSVPPHQSRKIYVRFMVRESLWVRLLMFWLWTSSQNFHKIAENTNACTEEDKYSDSNILGRYSYNGSNDGWKPHVQRHCNLPPATFRFCFNLEKLILNPVQEIEFLGVTINSLKMCLSSPQEVLKIKSQCQDIHSKGYATVHELIELLGFLPQQFRKLSAQMNFEYLQQQQIKALTETQKLSSNCIPQQQFKRTNLSDGSKISRFSVAAILFSFKIFWQYGQMHPREGSWGAICQGIPIGGEWNTKEQQLHINVLEIT